MVPESGAEIQVDAGEYVRLHHAILETLAVARLNGGEYRAIMFLLRKTYGWNKKEDAISLAQWSEGTNTARPNILKILDGLVAKRVFLRREGPGQVPIYGFNKYIEQWQGVMDKDVDRGHRFTDKVLSEQATVICPDNATVITQDNSTVICPDNATVICLDTHKRQLKTPLKTKKEKSAASRSPDPLLEHPAVVMYRDLCHMTPNAVQRREISERVANVGVWQRVLERWMLSGWKPGNVSGQLERYATEVGTNGTGHKDVQVVQSESGEWVAVEVGQ